LPEAPRLNSVREFHYDLLARSALFAAITIPLRDDSGSPDELIDRAS